MILHRMTDVELNSLSKALVLEPKVTKKPETKEIQRHILLVQENDGLRLINLDTVPFIDRKIIKVKNKNGVKVEAYEYKLCFTGCGQYGEHIGSVYTFKQGKSYNIIHAYFQHKTGLTDD